MLFMTMTCIEFGGNSGPGKNLNIGIFLNDCLSEIFQNLAW